MKNPIMEVVVKYAPRSMLEEQASKLRTKLQKKRHQCKKKDSSFGKKGGGREKKNRNKRFGKDVIRRSIPCRLRENRRTREEKTGQPPF